LAAVQSTKIYLAILGKIYYTDCTKKALLDAGDYFDNKGGEQL